MLTGTVKLQAQTNPKLHFFLPVPGKQAQMHKFSIKDEKNVLVKVNALAQKSSSVRTCFTDFFDCASKHIGNTNTEL